MARAPSVKPEPSPSRGRITATNDGQGTDSPSGRPRLIRVAHLIQAADAQCGGTSTAFLNILAAVGAAGDEISLSAYFQRPPDGDPAWATINSAPERFHLASTTGKRLLAGDLGHMLARDLAAGKIDVLHVHGLWSPDLLLATRAARRAGVPYVWQSHGMFIRWAWNMKRLKKRLFLLAGLQRCLDAAHSFILTSPGELETSVYPKTITPDKRHLIPLPVPIPPDLSQRPLLAREGRTRFSIPAEAPVMTFLGRLHPVKRVDLTIDSFAAASRQIEGLRLLLLGSGDADYVASLRERADRLGVLNRVIFAGWVDGEQKARALAAADVLVLNSVGESFGYVLFDAIGGGTAIVMTENLSLAQDFRAAGAAVVTAPEADAIAQGVVEVLRHPDRAAMPARALDWARQTYSTAVVGRKLLGVYKNAAGRTGG